MKKIKLTLLFISMMALTAAAQDGKFGIGIKGGFNFTNLYTDDDNVDKEKMMVGYHAGAYLKIPLNDRIGIQPEVLLSTKGARYEYGNFLGGSGDFRFNLNYVDVPVMLVVNLFSGINIHAGPYFGILTSTDLNNRVEGGENVVEDLDKSDFNTNDAGVAAGASIEFNKISIGARYNHGLSKVGKEKTYFNEKITIPDAMNSNFQVYLALRLL